MPASFLDTLSEIVVTKEDILKSESFSKQYLSSIFPDLDLRDNVALSDLVIRPTSVLLAMIEKGLTAYFNSNSLVGVTDDTPEADVDRLMSNLFLSRLVGSNSVIRARLYFLRGDRDVFVSDNNTFSADNSNFFKPVVDTFIPSNSLVYDGTKDEYYYDLDLISVQQTDESNLEDGDLIYHSQVDPYFIQATVLYLSTRAVPAETNLEFISRSYSAISTRNLINTPSIVSAVLNLFNYIKKIQPVGMGEPEMRRDLVSIVDPYESVNRDIHIGGKVDVYVNAELSTEVKQYQTNTSGAIYIDSSEGTPVTIVRATSGQLSENNLEDDIPVSTNPTYTFGSYVNEVFQPLGLYNDFGMSANQVIKVQFTGVTVPSTASFSMLMLKGLYSLQAYLDDTVSRVVCANYLARSLNVYYLTINIKRTEGRLLDDESVSLCTELLKSYIDSLKAGEDLVVSNLISLLVNNTEIVDLDNNMSVSWQRLDKDFVGTSGIVSSILLLDRTSHCILKEVTSE